MNESITINVAKEFYPRPLGRIPEDGEYNGTLFKDSILIPAIKNNRTVVVDFHGVAMAGSSFLEEAFGGIIRERIITKKDFSSRIIILTDRQVILDRIKKYVSDAEPK